MTSKQLQVGKKYKVDGTILYCVGVNDADFEGYNCQACGRELKRAMCFMDTLDDRFTINMIVGSECLKKLIIEEV